MAHRQLTSLMTFFFAVFGWGQVMAAGPAPRHHVDVEIVAEKSAVQPGSVLTVAVRERIAPGWHTYWINPGDSGEPTSIEWGLPAGAVAGPILWPVPHVIPIGPLANYGYEDELLLLTDIEIPKLLDSGNVTLTAKVTYLVCNDICVPEEANVQLTLPVSDTAGPSQFAPRIANARDALPTALPGSASYAVNPAKGSLRLSILTAANVFGGVTDIRFFPLRWGVVSNPAAQPKTIEGGRLTLDLEQGDTKETPDRLEGVLVLTKGQGEGARIGYAVSAARGPDSSAPGSLSGGGETQGLNNTGSQTSALDGVSGSAGIAVLFAFLGGVILNLMPCVFPVLALKALGFAKTANGGHRRQGLAYLAGVLASFGALAIGIAAFRAGTSALGWGFQFQSPAFVLALALLFFVMGLSLSGAVSFGGGLMSAGDSLARKPGNAGYFFTGVLAAVAATPCTAPFMGAALGYAVTQPFYILIAVMLGLGLGFAAPVVALSFSPAMQRILPKPGAWMETLKQVLAFPLYATTAWLVWILSIQTGSDGVMAAALAIVGVGFAAWLAGKTAFSSLPLRLMAPLLGIAAFAAGLSLASNVQPDGTVAPSGDALILKEEPFTQARLAELKAQGRPVFVNLTAAWCITCKVNERVALKSSAVAEAFQSGGIVYLKGDWTRANPEITDLLQHFGRAGVPLYLFYPGRGAEPRVLPQLLTASLVLEELKSRSAQSKPSAAKGA